MVERDFLVDEKGAMIIRNGEFATGESLHQEVALILLTNRGEIRHDMLCGCDLIKFMNKRVRRSELERVIRLQLERDGKSWADIKNGIDIKSNG